MRKFARFHLPLTVTAIALASATASAQTAGSLTRAAQATNAEERFKRLDPNGDGRFDRAEYLQVRNQAERQAEARIRQMLTAEFAELDANKDQNLTAAEIDSKVKVADAGKKTLARLDKNKDSKVSAAEYTSQASNLEAAADPDMQMRQWDANGDKLVTRQEFVGAILTRFDSFDANKDGTVTAQEAAAKVNAASATQGR